MPLGKSRLIYTKSVLDASLIFDILHELGNFFFNTVKEFKGKVIKHITGQ